MFLYVYRRTTNPNDDDDDDDDDDDGVIFKPIDALSVLCAQLTHDLLAIAKFSLSHVSTAMLMHDIDIPILSVHPFV